MTLDAEDGKEGGREGGENVPTEGLDDGFG